VLLAPRRDAPPEEQQVKITLTSDESIRLEAVPGMLTIEAPSADRSYSPFHMLASSLATCTFAVLYSWASNANVTVDDLVIDVRWAFTEDPHRVSEMRTTLIWPTLPQSRRSVAERVAALCTVHATLLHPPELHLELAS
jgi:uncharacterized OsmC-like protein